MSIEIAHCNTFLGFEAGPLTIGGFRATGILRLVRPTCRPGHLGECDTFRARCLALSTLLLRRMLQRLGRTHASSCMITH